MTGRDYGDYKNQRRKEHRKVSQSMQDEGADGMFFGTSPKEKKEARQTVDKRKIDLDKLDLNALDRERYNAPKKVGESLRLIDMAMSDSGPQQAITRQQAAKAKAQAAAKAKAQAAARAKAQAAAKAKAQAAAKAKAQAKARQMANSRAQAQAKAQAAAKAKAERERRQRAQKAAKKTKGVHISDLGLKVTPKKRTPSGRIKRGGPRR